MISLPEVPHFLVMSLTIKQIRGAGDGALMDLLLVELKHTFPPSVRNDPIVFLSRFQSAGKGMQAMALTYDLDVSLTLDDLAWHFVNHHDSWDLAGETMKGLYELEANELAAIFGEA